jgi:hypothetical protein
LTSTPTLSSPWWRVHNIAKNLPLLSLPTRHAGAPWLVLKRRFGKGEGEGVDLVADPVGIALLADEAGEDARVELVLGDEHAGGEGLGVVAGQNATSTWPRIGPSSSSAVTMWTVQPVTGLARGQDGGVGVEAAVAGEERRVDVDDPPGPAIDERSRG